MYDSIALSLRIVLPSLVVVQTKARPIQRSAMHCGTSILIQGDLTAVFLLTGNKSTFQQIAINQYNMTLQQAMIPSFVCELGNMIVGTLSTLLENEGIQTKPGVPNFYAETNAVTANEIKSAITVFFSNVGEIHVYWLQGKHAKHSR